MEVILLERVGRLGTLGDVVKVKDGYARNFLLPRKKALRATQANKSFYDAKRSEIEAENAATRAVAEKKAAALKQLSVTLVRQASEDGKLYGSVTVRDIVDDVQAQGHDISRKQIELVATIKNTGSYTVRIVLHPEVMLTVPVYVVRNESDKTEELPEELSGASLGSDESPAA